MKNTLKTKRGPHLIVTESDIISGESLLLYLKASFCY